MASTKRQAVALLLLTSARGDDTTYSRMMVGCDLGGGDFDDFGTHSADPKLCQQACDEVRAIMTPNASPNYGGFHEVKDDCGFGDLGLDEHEKAVLELSLRRQAKIERKLNRIARKEQDKKSRSQRRSNNRPHDERTLDLSNGTAGPEQFAAAAIDVSPRSSRRARGVMKPKVSGRLVHDDISEWDNEVTLATGLPAVRGASATPSNEFVESQTPRLRASPPMSARGLKQSPRGETGSSRRRERRARRERQAAEVRSDDDGDHDFHLEQGMNPTDKMDKMEKLRIAMAQMDGEDQRTDGKRIDTGTVTTNSALPDDGPKAEEEVCTNDPEQEAAAAAAAAVADAKVKAEAAVKEAARLVRLMFDSRIIVQLFFAAVASYLLE